MESTLAVPPSVVKRDEPLGPVMLQQLRERQAAWAAAPVRDRLRVIRRLRQLLPDMQDEFCAGTQADLHKPPAETLSGELLPVAAACQFLERRAGRLLRPKTIAGRDTPLWLFGERDVVVRKPRGVVGIIGTWNYPYFLNGVQIVQALAAGNVVIWKPSEVAPRSAEVLTRWLRRAEVPAELVHVLPADREWGPRLADADVDYIVFTGHDATGRKLAARLGERLVPSTLELSGHDAMLVLADANLDLTAKAIRFGMTMNAGQTCLAPRRVFVARQVYAALQEKLKTLCAEVPARSLAQRQQAVHINGLIDAAIKQGARRIVPTTAEADDPYPATVLADVLPDMAICDEALFAPVVLLLPFEEVREATLGIRRCKYGLGLSIFTADPARARQLAATLPAGVVSINDLVAPVAHPATPFGGVGRSGWGVTQGAEGLLELTVPQVISQRRGAWRPHYDPPNSSVFTDPGVLAALLRWQHGNTFGRRLAALWGLIRAARRARKSSS